MKSRHAFSLIELSIVLVILGLLVGGILAGQSLIRASELRSITAQFHQFQSAVRAFQDKYIGLPGDLSNATSFWGDQATGTGSCSDTNVANGTPGTCNGNGNGQIEFIGSANSTLESFRIWRQLALAGLIEGTYTGYSGPGNASGFHRIPGVNSPTGKIGNSAWEVWYYGNNTGDSYAFATTAGNTLSFGVAVTNGGVWDPVMRPEETWNLDTKIDDGRPGRGKLIIRHWNSCTDAANRYALDANYDLTYTTLACGLYFVNAF